MFAGGCWCNLRGTRRLQIREAQTLWHKYWAGAIKLNEQKSFNHNEEEKKISSVSEALNALSGAWAEHPPQRHKIQVKLNHFPMTKASNLCSEKSKRQSISYGQDRPRRRLACKEMVSNTPNHHSHPTLPFLQNELESRLKPSSHASTAMPRQRDWISPSVVGEKIIVHEFFRVDDSHNICWCIKSLRLVEFKHNYT